MPSIFSFSKQALEPNSKIFMSKNVVIVESPAKAKTIEGYLGKDFKVASSYGHIRDLPKGDKAIDIKKPFQANL